jgi:hypothetical protein
VVRIDFFINDGHFEASHVLSDAQVKNESLDGGHEKSRYK